jgi:hypothetical protein
MCIIEFQKISKINVGDSDPSKKNYSGKKFIIFSKILKKIRFLPFLISIYPQNSK